MAFLSGIAGSLGGVGLGSAVVAVAVDTAPLKAGLEQAKADVAASTSSMSASTKAIGTGFIIAGALAVVGMAKAVHSVEALGTSTLNLQRVTGQTAQSASALLFVADKLGVSSQSLSAGFGLLSKNIDNGSKVLAKFGLVLTNADGTTKDFNTILGIAADKYVALGGGLTGAAFAQELFGRGGKALIPILEQGSAGLAAMEAEAQKYGLVLSQDTVNQVKSLMIAQRDLSASFQGLQVAIGTDLLPLVSGFVHLLTDLVGILHKIPAPVMDAVLIFTALTGALFVGQKALALLGATWGPVLAKLSVGTTAAGGLGASLAALGPAAAAVGVPLTVLGVAMWATSGGAAESAARIAQMVSALDTGAVSVADLQTKIDGLSTHTMPYFVHGVQGADIVQSRFQGRIDETKAAIDQYGASTAAAIDPTTGLTAAQTAAAAAATAMKTATDALLPGILGLIGQESALATAQKTLTHDMNAQHPSMVTIRADQLALLNAQQGVNTSLKTQAQNMLDSGKSADFVINKLEALGAKAGLTKNQVDRLASSVGALHTQLSNLPPSVTVQINLNETLHRGAGFG